MLSVQSVQFVLITKKYVEKSMSLNTGTLVREKCEYQRTQIVLWTQMNAIKSRYNSDQITS
jgi:hypothetical protein